MDREKIIAGAKLILEGIGEDLEREGLVETPERIARMYEEIFSGLTLEEQDIYDRVNHHIMENTKKAMARREKHE